MYDLKPYLKVIDEVIERGPYQDNWDSLSQYQVPKWYKNAKFGIFIHWGVYSVPAFGNEWYSRNMYIPDHREYQHHIDTYGPHKDFGYKDFVPMFKAEKFDSDKWAELFAKSGAKYVVPVCEHHDGFQMYKSEISHWNAYEMGPKRDVVGNLKKSVEDKGLTLGASTHRFEHWFFMGHGKDFDSDVKEPLQRGDFYWPAMAEPENTYDLTSEPWPTQEYIEDWLVRTCELIDNYRPKVLYFDWWIHHVSLKKYLQKLTAYYYNRAAEWGEEVVICYKHDAFLFGTAVPDVERGQFADIKPYYWQTDTSINLNSWCYTDNNNNFRDAKGLIQDLVDIVSKNGNLLLNVGPKADGTITEDEQRVLTEIGDWLSVNGEAIYESSTYRVAAEGPTQIVEGQFADGNKKEFTSEDFRFTVAHGNLYAIALNPSENGDYCIKTLAVKDFSKQANFGGIIHKISVLGYDGEVTYTRDEEGLKIHADVKTDKPVTFKIELL